VTLRRIIVPHITHRVHEYEFRTRPGAKWGGDGETRPSSITLQTRCSSDTTLNGSDGAYYESIDAPGGIQIVFDEGDRRCTFACKE